LGLLLNLVRAQIKAKKLKDKIKIPLLFLLAGEDKLVDPRPVKRLFESLKLEDKTIFIYPEMYHALSIDIGREKVFRDMLKWAEERL
ncbi:alpha/beta hydrolase, partial [Candidatus Omnitrophota bacterium]